MFNNFVVIFSFFILLSYNKIVELILYLVVICSNDECRFTSAAFSDLTSAGGDC